MTLETFHQAIDSMEGYRGVIGFQGAEPLLHKHFVEMCEYARSKFPKDQLGLWTTLPDGYTHYSEVISTTFGHIFINDHSRDDILHAPLLVKISEVIADPIEQCYMIDHCWVQNSWSAAITPRGAYFCEVAANLDLLNGDGSKAWPIEVGWWRRSPLHFTDQIVEFCFQCGGAIPMAWRRSVETVDDMSPAWVELLKEKSPKVKAGKYVISDLAMKQEARQRASYKDQIYREHIANRYNLTLMTNPRGYLTPVRKLRIAK
jgi:hypothetical protein